MTKASRLIHYLEISELVATHVNSGDVCAKSLRDNLNAKASRADCLSQILQPFKMAAADFSHVSPVVMNFLDFLNDSPSPFHAVGEHF